MKFRKLFKNTASILLVLSMLIAILPLNISATESIENESIIVYVTVGNCGEIVVSDNIPLAAIPVELADNSSYTLDDVFIAVHNSFFDGGAEAGYETYDHPDFGLGLTKFWGNDSGNFGYQINGGTEAVMNLDYEVADGDYIDVHIYQSSWPNTEDYTVFDTYNIVTYPNDHITLTLNQMGYNENFETVFSPCSDAMILIDGEECDLLTDSNGEAILSFDEPGTYVVSASKTKIVSETEAAAITAPVCIATVVDANAKISVPSDAELHMFRKGEKHFVSFTEAEPVTTYIDNGTETYFFTLEDGGLYNYRASGDNYITYAGMFEKTDAASIEITEDMLCPSGKTKTSIDRNLSSNNGYNVADIYLNINPQGYLKLSSVGDTYQLIPLRSWEAINDEITNCFIEPDYHYTIIDESGEPSDDVVSVDEDGLLTAIGEGTAIVLVTYDALTYENGLGGPFYGAIWPENTGVFVVTIGAEESGIVTGMTINEGRNSTSTKLSGDNIDAEHDIIYFIGNGGFYTFTPETDGCSVSVANPIIDDLMSFDGFCEVIANDDGSFDVPLTEGRNIVKIENDSGTEYQIITAKEISISINDGDTTIRPGDSVSISFDTLYHPANKLAGVYNMSALPVYTEVSGYDDAIVGGLPSQYDFASNSDAQTVSSILKAVDFWGSVTYESDGLITIPKNYREDTFTLSGGAIYVTGWGDSYGNHRNISLSTGKAPNLDANPRDGFLGLLPDIEIDITPRPIIDGGVSSGSGGSSINKPETETNEAITDTPSFSEDTFPDVSNSDWYYGSVKYVYENALMNGIGDGFGPLESMTRSMLVTVLYRLSGADKPEGSCAFSDIPVGEWYSDAVTWASENGIVNGISNSLFAPDEDITREQLATILFRYAEKMGYDISWRADLSQFADATDASDWAIDAISWANASGIVNGTSNTSLSPLGIATRSEVATMLMRFCVNIK